MHCLPSVTTKLFRFCVAFFLFDTLLDFPVLALAGVFFFFVGWFEAYKRTRCRSLILKYRPDMARRSSVSHFKMSAGLVGLLKRRYRTRVFNSLVFCCSFNPNSFMIYRVTCPCIASLVIIRSSSSTSITSGSSSSGGGALLVEGSLFHAAPNEGTDF